MTATDWRRERLEQAERNGEVVKLTGSRSIATPGHDPEPATTEPSEAKRAAIRTEFERAAIALAVHVLTVERIAADPEYAADRSARADRLRERNRREAIERFRAASVAYLGE